MVSPSSPTTMTGRKRGCARQRSRPALTQNRTPPEDHADQRPSVVVDDCDHQEQGGREGKRNPEHQEQGAEDCPLTPSELELKAHTHAEGASEKYLPASTVDPLPAFRATRNRQAGRP